ncbi:hypothetical protein D3C81_1346330 [compost metagenome]
MRQALGQLVGIFPAAQAQQQAQAPFGDGVVTQLGVVAGHQVQRPRVVATRQGQADFAGDGDFLVAGEMHAVGVIVKQAHGPLRVLAGQAAQAEADHVGHRLVDRGEASGLVEQFGLLRHVDQQAALGCQGVEAFDQGVGQRIVAGLRSQLGALPAFLLGQLAFASPAIEQRIAGCRLRLADQPEFFCAGIAFGALAMAELVLTIKAVQFGEVQFWIVVLGEGRPVTALGQPAQPAQLHPVGLGQVAVGGEEFLDFVVTGGFQPGGQFVVGQVGR